MLHCLFINTLFYVDIYNESIKHSDLYNSLYTSSYTNGIQKTDIYANLHQPKIIGNNKLPNPNLGGLFKGSFWGGGGGGRG